MTGHSQLQATIRRLFADGDLSADEFATSDDFSAVLEPAGGRLDDRIKEKLPPDLLRPLLPDGYGPADLEFSQIVMQALLERWKAEREIRDLAATLGWVGQPTSEFSYTGNDGYARHFQNASIYWTKSFGAKEVHGAIRDRYWQMGAEQSYLGYPQTNELSAIGADHEEVRYSNFQGGIINWTAKRGAFILPSFSPITKRHQLGAWISMVGSGFTPNGRVIYAILNPPWQPLGMGAERAAFDGRVGANPNSRYVADLRNLGGDRPPSIARAIDKTTGQFADSQLSYALH